MEGPPVLGPRSWQSRGWREEEEEEEEEQPWQRPPPLDKGRVCSKIQRWLRGAVAEGAGSPRCVPIVPSVSPSATQPRGDPGGVAVSPPCVAACGGFEDELSPGAEALLLPGSPQDTERAQRYRHLSLGDSMASSVPSDVTSSVPSSVTSSFSLSQVLARCRSDPEAILLSLGFAGPDAGLSALRVPPRFFSCPSRASGIDLGLFLRAQRRRQRAEDTSLQLASRFQQVQALAATADAFFCLHSHVSRAPRPYRDIPDSAEPRLKRAVTSLCLCTGRGHGDIPGDTATTPATGGLREDRDTRRLSATSDPVGTARGQRCCPHGRRGRGDTRDTRGPLPSGVGDTGGAGGTPGRVPKKTEHRGAAESREEEEEEEEEVLSEEDDDDDDDDDDEDEDDEAARSPHPHIGTLRSSTFQGPFPPWLS